MIVNVDILYICSCGLHSEVFIPSPQPISDMSLYYILLYSTSIYFHNHQYTLLSLWTSIKSNEKCLKLIFFAQAKRVYQDKEYS